jgi:putative Flp pilus-assembly TadE/G-like protein
VHVTPHLRDERGGVLVMAAVMIPVFLLLTALVVDVGNWYTHKRQLQNRADAAAFAAGVEYARNWKACVQTGNAALRATTGGLIADAARQYAGDPEASDYSTGIVPAPLRNTEIANQGNLDVVVNSNDPDYNDDTDYTDGGGTPPQGNPCYLHTTGDDISSPGHWTDVRVKERNIPSLFGSVGLPIARNGARARIEIRPAISGHRFRPLADQYQGGVPGVGTLWGLPSTLDPTEGDPAQRYLLALPSYGTCGQPYLPIGVQVRIASRDEINLDTNSCAQLLAMQYADCFSRLSQIRLWNDGDPNNQARIGDVRLTGGCRDTDAYFETLPVGETDCRIGASVFVNWGDRSTGDLEDPDNFSVTVNGRTAVLSGSLNGPTGGEWIVPSSPGITANPGPNTITVSLNWEDTDPMHVAPNSTNHCRNGNNNPCQYSLTQPVHQSFVGTEGIAAPAGAGAVALVRTSTSPWNAGTNQPGDPYATEATGGFSRWILPTIGIRSVLRTGVYTTLRLDDPQANQTLRCDPNYAQGQEFSAFRFGCQPWYGENHFNGDVLGTPNNTASWWNSSARTCPGRGQWFSYGNQGAGFGVNSSNNPWRCVLTAPGLSTGQIGDDIAVATDNCDNINNNSCQSFDCNFDGNYDGKGGVPGWAETGGTPKLGSEYPRVVNLFIVPYQASKGLTGQGDEIPVLGFASFYVMDWGGANSNQSDPCPDTTWDHDDNPATAQITMPRAPRGAISGVFVEKVEYEPGPVDTTAVCVEDQLTPCRVTLVR